jgi:predicted nucleotidyltransferase
VIYQSKEGDLDLAKITRLYPAVVVDMHGEVAEMSLEWVDLYGEKVKILRYVLVFDFTPLNEDVKDRTTLVFSTKEELIAEIQEVAKYLD